MNIIAAIDDEQVRAIAESVRLTRTEERLLRALVVRGQLPRRTRSDLIRETWGNDYVIDHELRASSDHMLRVVISRMRSKLRGSGWKIDTRPGLGYALQKT